mgnify:CR=1 FL=1
MTIYKSTIKLLRIPFSINLLPLYLFAIYSAMDKTILWKSICVFIVIHFIFYPASNAYNSFMDRDHGSIAGLQNPPKPTKQLFHASIILDILGLVISTLISWPFFLINLLLVGLSRAYSWRAIRIKKYAIPAFVMVAFAQGGISFYNMYIGVQGLHYFPKFEGELLLRIIICTLFVGTIYPITQIYQHEDDKKDGVHSMSMLLGIKGTFLFSGLLFIGANVLLYVTLTLQHFIIFEIFMILPALYFVHWAYLSWKNEDHANYSKTMTMALGASIAIILGFSFILLL